MMIGHSTERLQSFSIHFSHRNACVMFLLCTIALLACCFASNVVADDDDVVYLSDLQWVSASNGLGPVELDMSNGGTNSGDGSIITLNGQTYQKGLGVHANSEIVYDISKDYSQFLADIGIDDEAGSSRGSVIFQVWADGTNIYESVLIAGRAPIIHIDLNVTGVDELKLIVTDAGNGNDYDHADWAGIRLVSVPKPPKDADNDQMPDKWERRYFHSTNHPNGAATADYDSDGLSNINEYFAGTDPTDADSVLEMTSVQKGDGSDLVLRWKSVRDKQYSIQTSTSLMDGFVTQASGIPATPPINTYAVPLDQEACYYKVLVD